MGEKLKIINQSTGQEIEVEPITEVTRISDGKVIKISPTIHHHDAVRLAVAKEKEEEKKEGGN